MRLHISAIIVMVLLLQSFLIVEDILEDVGLMDGIGRVEGAVITVGTSGSPDYTCIQDAIDNATNGDTIQVWAGTYNENVLVNKTLTLMGNGAANTIINGGGGDYGIKVVSDCVNISDFQIIAPQFLSNDDGIVVYESDHCSIVRCVVNSSYSGIKIGPYSHYGSVENNTCFNNLYHGIIIHSSLYGIVKNNTCFNNLYSNIEVYGSKYCEVDNNSCYSNITYQNMGLRVRHSCHNIITNNICMNDSGGEILVWKSYNNTILSNDFCGSQSSNGMHLNDTYNNTIAFNNISSNNKAGILITRHNMDPSNNHIHHNSISSNSIGWNIASGCNSNHFYHNQILFNSKQATDKSVNTWNNIDLEGNSWSDYRGLDNGANGRTADDGIGDTNIPHLGLDQYPLMNAWSNAPPSILVIYDPGELVLDGNYSLSWTGNQMAEAYTLEEDESGLFSSPIVVYDGGELSHTVTLQEDGTFYYRVKAYNSFGDSPWSNCVDIVVDRPPSRPKGLIVKVSTEDSVTISWDRNPESDISGYRIYKNMSGADQMGPFYEIDNVDKDTMEYTAEGLTEFTYYHFRICSYDGVPTNSSFSTVVGTSTLLGPHAPEIHNPLMDIDIMEDTVDLTSINLFDTFVDINNDTLDFWCTGDNNLTVVIDQGIGSVTITPNEDWNGVELLTFHASDETDAVSDQVDITVTPVNDPPGPAIIVEPNEGTTVESGMSVDVRGQCDDPDIPYGDILKYVWSSNITGPLDITGASGTTTLQLGHHQITLSVSDLEMEMSVATVNISVILAKDPDINGTDDPEDINNTVDPIENDTTGDNDDDPIPIEEIEDDIDNDVEDGNNTDSTTPHKGGGSIAVMAVIIVIIIIVLVLVFIFHIRKREKPSEGERREQVAETDDKGLLTTGPVAIPTPIPFPSPSDIIPPPTKDHMQLIPSHGISSLYKDTPGEEKDYNNNPTHNPQPPP